MTCFSFCALANKSLRSGSVLCLYFINVSSGISFEYVVLRYFCREKTLIVEN